MKYYKSIGGMVHAEDVWMEICNLAVMTFELNISGLEYFQWRIETGMIKETKDPIDILKARSLENEYREFKRNDES